MNPEHLTVEIRKVVSDSIIELRKIKKQEGSTFQKTGKAFETDNEVKEFFDKFYKRVKDKMTINEFYNLCSLEDQYGFCSGYLGGEALNKNGDTVIEIK